MKYAIAVFEERNHVENFCGYIDRYDLENNKVRLKYYFHKNGFYERWFRTDELVNEPVTCKCGRIHFIGYKLYENTNMD